jgi:hypothetical protein
MSLILRTSVHSTLLALLSIAFAAAVAGCGANRPLYVYRAYQDPKTTQGPYYLRDALVVAPDHATAMDIIAAAMTEVHPSWSGPLYVSFVGMSEDQRRPGLLGGPVWLASSDAPTKNSLTPQPSGEVNLKNKVTVGPPDG